MLGIGLKSESSFVTAKLARNVYGEIRPDGEKSKIVAFGRPGRDLFVQFGATPIRGAWWIQTGTLAYVVHRSVLWSVDNAGNKTNLGMLNTTSGRVSMSDNGQQLMIVDGTYGYIYSTVAIPGGATPQAISTITYSAGIATLTTASPHLLVTGNIVSLAGQVPAAYIGNYTITVTGASTFTFPMDVDPGGAAGTKGTYTITQFAQITSPSFPANPQTVTFLLQCFEVQSLNSRAFFVSGISDGLNGYALNFATAEDHPDPMVAIWTSNGQLFLLCAAHSEFWGASGGQDFLFSEVQGTTSEWGLAATFGVARYGNTVACLMRNRTNQVMIAQIVGYMPQPLSNPDLDKIINGYANVADASFYSMMLGGHPLLICNFPSAGATWCYDGSTKIWSPWDSMGLTRDFGEFSFPFLGEMIICDYAQGNLYKLNPASVTDNGQPITVQMTGETLRDPDGGRFTVNRFRLDIQVGDGNTVDPGSNPQVGLEISRDNGKTYGAQMLQPLGKLGNYSEVVEWDMLGTMRNFTPRITMTDPVKFCLVSASVNPSD